MIKIQDQLISSDPEITAMQITADEDFMILGSAGVFERLQGIDIMNILWQQALIEQMKNKNNKINPGILVDTLIKLSAFKRESFKNNAEDNSVPNSSFTVILIIFKSFE